MFEFVNPKAGTENIEKKVRKKSTFLIKSLHVCGLLEFAPRRPGLPGFAGDRRRSSNPDFTRSDPGRRDVWQAKLPQIIKGVTWADSAGTPMW